VYPFFIVKRGGETMTKNERLITVKEFADRLGLAEITVRKWIGQKKIQSIKMGSMRRIPESEVDRLKNGGEAVE
jgi:excisionase family DNA binding protein